MTSSDEDDTLYEKQKLLKSGSRKPRIKERVTTATLIDVETGLGPLHSVNEFDGTGLDKAPAALRELERSEEELL